MVTSTPVRGTPQPLNISIAMINTAKRIQCFRLSLTVIIAPWHQFQCRGGMHYRAYAKPLCVSEMVQNRKLWHRIIAARMPRMTARNAFDAHPSALGNAVLFHGIVCILGAGRMVSTTAAQSWRDEALVEANQREGHTAHGLTPLKQLSDGKNNRRLSIFTHTSGRMGIKQQMRPPKEAGAGGIHHMIICAADWAPCNKNDIPARLDGIRSQPNCFAQATLDLVPLNCIADPFTDRKPITTVR